MAKAKPDSGLAATVDAAEFGRRLSFVTGAVPRRTTVPILECVLLKAGPGDRLTLTASNLDQQSETGMVADVAARGAICVNAGRLATVVSRMSGELTLVAEENMLKLSAGRARAELPTLPAGDFASMAFPDGGETFEIASGALAAGFGSVMHAASTEETRYYLNGVYVEATFSGGLIFTATDGHRLATLKVTAGLPDGVTFEPIIVPRAVLRDYVKFCERADGPVLMTVSDNRLQLSAQGETHITKLIDGSFPDYERVIPKGAGVRLAVPKSELKAAVSVALTGSEEKSRSVRFEATEGQLVCRSRGELGFAEGLVEFTDIAPCEVFGLSGKYVLDAIEACRGEEIEMTVIDPASPVRISCGDELRQVVMPLRV